MDTERPREFFESVKDALTRNGQLGRETSNEELSSDEEQSLNEGECSDEEERWPKKHENVPKLGDLAFEQACHDLQNSITGARAAACFVCGGTVPTVSSVRVCWDRTRGVKTHKLVLPLQSEATENSSQRRLQELVSDCEPASFGRGQEDVLDPEYRKAGKLDPSRFVSDFCPHKSGIVRLAEQYLLPNYKKHLEHTLPFRSLKAELYKLNVYSGPSGLFQKHVDTPRSRGQIGSLVVCLPSTFKGGNLVIRHAGKEVDFDWAPGSASTIQWAAFYSDCEHEIMTVTEGERITLTYNLFVVEPDGECIPQPDITDPTKMPLYGFMRSLVSEPGFMKDGGVLGIYCSHAYPHAAENAQQLLPRGLKGADLAVYSVFKSLDLEVDVLPVLRDAEIYNDYRSLRGEVVGTSLHPFSWNGGYPSETESELDIIREDWPSEELAGVTWLAEPEHEEMACSIVTYGNEYTSSLVYSYAATLTIIPPFAKRQSIIGALN